MKLIPLLVNLGIILLVLGAGLVVLEDMDANMKYASEHCQKNGLNLSMSTDMIYCAYQNGSKAYYITYDNGSWQQAPEDYNRYNDVFDWIHTVITVVGLAVLFFIVTLLMRLRGE